MFTICIDAGLLHLAETTLKLRSESDTDYIQVKLFNGDYKQFSNFTFKLHSQSNSCYIQVQFILWFRDNLIHVNHENSNKTQNMV